MNIAVHIIDSLQLIAPLYYCKPLNKTSTVCWSNCQLTNIYYKTIYDLFSRLLV